MKEVRTIPNLIYAIEQYERYLIQLSKKSKVSPFVKNIARPAHDRVSKVFKSMVSPLYLILRRLQRISCRTSAIA